MASNLDRSYIGPYLQDWLKYIRERDLAEQQVIESGDEFRIPYSGIQLEMIQAIFIIAERFGVEPQAKYLAAHLLDRYLGCLFYELVTSCCTGGVEPTETVMRQVRNKMAGQMKLVLATCLQIASKVDLYKTGLGISQIQDILQSIEPERAYSKTSITSCEIRILRSLDFRLPLGLPVHALELFLAYTELTAMPMVRETCFHLMDIAYLRHEDLYEQLHQLARGRSYDKSRPDCREFMGLESHAGFLAAAVVVCSNFFFRLKKKIVDTLAAKLAKLVEMSPIDLNVLANILFTYAIDEEDFKALHCSAED